MCDVVDEMRERGVRTGALAITSFRPFPLEAVRAALGGSRQVVVLERALAVGIGGIVSANVRTALSGIQLDGHTVVAGLGGRAITKSADGPDLRFRAIRASSRSTDRPGLRQGVRAVRGRVPVRGDRHGARGVR